MRVTGFWQSWLLPLILVLTLVGVSRGLGAEVRRPRAGRRVNPEGAGPAAA